MVSNLTISKEVSDDDTKLNILGNKIHFIGTTKLNLSGALIALVGIVTLLVSAYMATSTYADIWFYFLGASTFAMLLGVILAMIASWGPSHQNRKSNEPPSDSGE